MEYMIFYYLSGLLGIGILDHLNRPNNMSFFTGMFIACFGYFVLIFSIVTSISEYLDKGGSHD